MRGRRGIALFLAAAASVVLTGCPDIPDLDALPGGVSGSQPSWCGAVELVFEVRCNGCHGENPTGGAPVWMRLDRYDDSGRLGAATMADSVAREVEAGRMPPTDSPSGEITESAARLLVGWAAAGAPRGDCNGELDAGVDAVGDGDAGDTTDDGSTADADADIDGFEIPDLAAPAPTLVEVSEQVFQTACTPHHVDRPSGGLSLAWSDTLYDDLLSPSVQNPPMPRVTPGNLEESYLWQKLNDTHESVGGSGNWMPIGNPLDERRLAIVRRWIEGGALE